MSRPFGRWLAIGATAACFYACGNLFQPTVVVGQSMSPTLRSGRVIWIDRTYYRFHRPERGEVVVFQIDGQTYVKRVYRAPGEKLCYLDADGDWLGAVRDGFSARAKERYDHHAVRVRQMTVPDDCVFVLGDNVGNSEDSRQFGPVPIRDLIGRARLDVDATKASAYEYVPRSFAARRAAMPHGEPAGVETPRQPSRAPERIADARHAG